MLWGYQDILHDVDTSNSPFLPRILIVSAWVSPAPSSPCAVVPSTAVYLLQILADAECTKSLNKA